MDMMHTGGLVQMTEMKIIPTLDIEVTAFDKDPKWEKEYEHKNITFLKRDWEDAEFKKNI